MNDDGTMARMPELEVFAKKYDMPIVTVEALIEYRRRRERLIDRRVQGVRMPTRYGDFTAHLYTALNDDKEHVALTFGWSDAPDGDNVPFEKLEESVTVRVHSECLTGDVLGSARCDCGQQLDAAMQQIASDGKGVLLYIRQEGRGIGLEAKLRAYQLQDQGFDTVEANEKLGYPADMRNYGTGAQILSDLGVRRMRLLTNNPKKLTGLAGYGLEITEQVSLQVEAGEHNCTYLRTKRDKMGHILPHLEH
jgi:3,4-dihydroxy 2-butanone 4-phosphate synthase/GTP cyclohydrolase II